LRWAMGKKKRSELEKQRTRFVEGAVKNGIKKDVTIYIFEKIIPFAEYGFNKSHAAAYAIIAYQTAYLKTYYPNEFFAASMSTELGNQNKLSEFYEELKRLDVKVHPPCINNCFAEFKSDEKNFYYALGAIKNVGSEAINNIIRERTNNGKYKSLEDFINRTDPKNINKLQLEGLVKAGAFNTLIKNKKAFYDNIPNVILSIKSFFDNKINNQTSLFDGKNETKQNFILNNIKDWSFEEKLSKEFESIGFFISDHPINQYREVFDIYKIQNYNSFINSSKDEAILAATIMKIQEKKTQKGTPFAIIKFSDLGGVFELYFFSEMLELNRNILKEGKSILVTVIKDHTNQDNRFRRINVRKVVNLNEISNQSLPNITFKIENLENLKNFSNLISEKGNTNVKIVVLNNSKNLVFELSEKRKINPQILKSLKNEAYLKGINI